MEHVELVVIGAGPAGIHAALAAAESGARVVLVDGYSQPGGQYFRQLPAAFRAEDRTDHHVQAVFLLRRLRGSTVRVLSNTTVWGVFASPAGDCWELGLNGPGAPAGLSANALILATGAYDRPVAFPGWTLPGVLTAGAAQTLLKSQRVLPGRRILLSGTGPLQLAVAASLVRAGAEVSAILEGSPLGPANLRQAAAMWGQWARLREGWGYLRTLQASALPLRLGRDRGAGRRPGRGGRHRPARCGMAAGGGHRAGGPRRHCPHRLRLHPLHGAQSSARLRARV